MMQLRKWGLVSCGVELAVSAALWVNLALPASNLAVQR
jgi:hypothetical protein